MKPPWMPTEHIDTPRSAGARDWITITGHTTSHVKGAYTELIASTAGPGYWLQFFWAGTAATATSGLDSSQLMDIAIGSAGNEVVIIPDIQTGWVTAYSNGSGRAHIEMPFYIPSGSRVSARLQGSVASDECTVNLDICGGSPPSGYFSACDAYGVTSAVSRGTQVQMAAVAWEEGAYVELTASTAEVIDALIFNIGGDDNQNAGSAYADIATGAAAAEVNVFDDFSYYIGSSESYSMDESRVIPLARPIPAGTRLSVRARGYRANDNSAWIHVHGLRL